MDDRREEGRDPGSEAPYGTGADRTFSSRSRACLIISLIFLVWNILATTRDGLTRESRTVRETPLPEATIRDVAHDAVPLTVRQGYLLGKKVDINAAGIEEINGLPGISDRVARAVVETRAARGPFRNPEALTSVPGIKEKRLKKLLPFLTGFDNN